jgi:hypothetical protein
MNCTSLVETSEYLTMVHFDVDLRSTVMCLSHTDVEMSAAGCHSWLYRNACLTSTMSRLAFSQRPTGYQPTHLLWLVTLCSFAVGYQRFRGPCYLHLQGEVLVSYHNTIRRHNLEDLDSVNLHNIISILKLCTCNSANYWKRFLFKLYFTYILQYSSDFTGIMRRAVCGILIMKLTKTWSKFVRCATLRLGKVTKAIF